MAKILFPVAPKVLPSVFTVMAEDGMVVCLIKPQFELSREEVARGGIVREPELHDKAVAKIREFIGEQEGWEWRDVMDSPIKGGDGNREFLAWLVRQ